MRAVEGTNQAGPSELAADKWLRLWTTVIVFLVLAGFGIPLWWSTTTVYRATLPTDRINDLSTSKVQLEVHLELLADSYHIERGDRLKSGLQRLLRKGGDGTQLDVDFVISVAGQPAWLHSATEEKLDLKDVIEKHTAGTSQPYSLSTNAKLKYKIVLQHSALTTGTPYVWIGARQYLLIRHSERDLEKVLPLIAKVTNGVLVQRDQAQAAFSSASSEAVDSKASRKDAGNLMALSSSAGHRLSFTLVNSDPGQVCVGWNIKDAVNKYLQPFLNQISPLADFVVHSQVLHYVSSDLVPSRSGDDYHLSYDQLSRMINPLESHLASHSSNLTTLQFIVYIPASDQSPLRILNQDGRVADNNSFLINRWGGLLVHNVEAATKAGAAGCRHSRLSDEEMHDIMAIFTSQLKSLLGVLKPDSDQLEDVILSSSSGSVTSWEWNSLLFSRTVENVARTRATLQALVQLLDDVANMVISDHIQEEVVRAVDLAEKCLAQLQQGHLADAYALSQRALVASEKAFFDPSMLSLLYFPEDSKYAIYVPLFIPMAVPVLASIVQSVKLYKQIRSLTSPQGSDAKTPDVRVKTD